MIFRWSVFTLLLLTGVLSAYSQEDSTLIDFESYLHMVRSNHPVYKQADLLLETGDANMRRARGNFDPVLKSAYENKQFGGKDYYQLNINELKIPTILGLELKAGYEKNSGLFLNPQNTVPDNGLAYAGISLPIGKGLFFDERRQALRQAEVFDRATELERTMMLNNLAYEAATEYWNWFAAWNRHAIFDEAVQLAEFRLEGVKQSFMQGDVPAIDTLEAYILVQNRQLGRNEAWIALAQNRLTISNYLWSEDQEPLELNPAARPIPLDSTDLEDPKNPSFISSILTEIKQSHPEILLVSNQIEHLGIERRWKTEKLKPKVNINYNFLNQPVGGNPFEGYSSNDYKWGFEIGMPLFLRKERGDLQLTKLKIQDTELKLDQKSLEIRNKIYAYQMEIENIYMQIELFKATIQNYQSLLRGERRKFEEGESSLFLVNSRETSLITAEVKLVELLSKYQKAQAGLIQAIGMPDEDFL